MSLRCGEEDDEAVASGVAGGLVGLEGGQKTLYPGVPTGHDCAEAAVGGPGAPPP